MESWEFVDYITIGYFSLGREWKMESKKGEQVSVKSVLYVES